VSRHLPRPQRHVRAWTGVREDFIELRSRHQAPPRPATLVRHKIGDHPTVHRHGERLTFGKPMHDLGVVVAQLRLPNRLPHAATIAIQ